MTPRLLLVSVSLAVFACDRPDSSPRSTSSAVHAAEPGDLEPGAVGRAPRQATTPAEAAPLGASAKPMATHATAAIGRSAPPFELRDLDGRKVSLGDHRGRVVVLEWFNPGCPFVRASHTVGSLKGTARRYTAEGIVWLTINSAAPGKQGHGVEANREAARAFGLQHPVLLDESGAVGKAYGAERTPHLFVIDPRGILVYAGAIDNSPDGEAQAPEGGKLVRYVEEAIAAVRAGRPVPVGQTKAYGCSVKYAI